MCKPSNKDNSEIPLCGAFLPGMPRTKQTPHGPEAERLRILITAVGSPTDAAFARRVGITTTRLSNVLGGSPIGRDMAHKLVKKIPGLSVDWLWFGNRSALSYDLGRRLDEAAEALEAEKGTTKARS